MQNWLIEALGVTYAAVGQEITDAALEIIARDLENYQRPEIETALTRCRTELRKIALADILDRIPTGHPGPEEAWAIVAPALTDETVTIIETDEIAHAFGIALRLADDPIAARMAFKEAYTAKLQEARSKRRKPHWFPSLGSDKTQRGAEIENAVSLGRLPASALLVLPKPDNYQGNLLAAKSFPE